MLNPLQQLQHQQQLLQRQNFNEARQSTCSLDRDQGHFDSANQNDRVYSEVSSRARMRVCYFVIAFSTTDLYRACVCVCVRLCVIHHLGSLVCYVDADV